MKKPPLSDRQLPRCRKLRQSSSDAEKRLWRTLRDRQMAGAKFRRQHSLGPYILDFCCPEARLAIELDGGQHAFEKQIRHDEQRSRYLADHGIQELRFWNNEVLENTEGVLEKIWSVLTPALSQGAVTKTHLAPQSASRIVGLCGSAVSFSIQRQCLEFGKRWKGSRRFPGERCRVGYANGWIGEVRMVASRR